MRIRKVLTIALSVIIILSCFTNVVSAKYTIEHKDITVTYNGEEIECSDQPPVIKGGSAMVPLRAVFERIGCKVSFDKGVITAIRGDETVTLAIGSKNAQTLIKGVKKEHILETEPIIENDKTLVPVRFVAEALGCKINWNPNQKEVVIIDTSAWKSDIKENAPIADALLCAPFANTEDNLINHSSIFEFDFKLKSENEDSKKQSDANIKLRLAFNGQTQSKDDQKKMSYSANIKFSGLKSYANQLKDTEKKQKLQKLADINKLSLEFVLDENYNAYVEISGIKKLTDALGVSKSLKNKEYLKIPLGEIMTEESGLPLGTILRTGSIWDGIEESVEESNTMFTQTSKTINDMMLIFKDLLNKDRTEIKKENGTTKYTLKDKSNGKYPTCAAKVMIKDNDITKCEFKASSEYAEITNEYGVFDFKWSADVSLSKAKQKQSKINVPTDFVEMEELEIN